MATSRRHSSRMSTAKDPIAVVGTGYVGLVTAASFAARGHEVFCIEKKREIAEQLIAGEVPFTEPRLQDIFDQARDRLHFHVDHKQAWRQATAHAGLIFMAVGTPSMAKAPKGGNGAAANGNVREARLDRGQIKAALEDGAKLGLKARVDRGEPTAIVMKSTVQPGTGAGLRKLLSEKLGRKDVAYVSCPEFLREGSAIKDFEEPDRVVIGGSEPWAVDAVARLFSFADSHIMRMSVESAELVKMASNGFLALAISYANELANLCDHLGADFVEVSHAMREARAEDIPAESFLTPGPGFGGSCFPKDVREFNHEIHRADPGSVLFDAVLEVNEAQPALVVDKIERRFPDGLRGKCVALLGLSFKKNTDDMREASSGKLAVELEGRGAFVRGFDPVVKGREDNDPHTAWMDSPQVYIEPGDLPYAVLENAHAAVLVTEWDSLKGLEWDRVAEVMAGKNPPFLDARNALDAESLEAAGLTYDGVGRGSALSRRKFRGADAQELGEQAADGYLALKREFNEELHRACVRFKANVEHVADGVGRDSRIGLAYLDPHAPHPSYDLDSSVGELLAKSPPNYMRLLRALRLRTR